MIVHSPGCYRFVAIVPLVDSVTSDLLFVPFDFGPLLIYPVPVTYLYRFLRWCYISVLRATHVLVWTAVTLISLRLRYTLITLFGRCPFVDLRFTLITSRRTFYSTRCLFPLFDTRLHDLPPLPFTSTRAGLLPRSGAVTDLSTFTTPPLSRLTFTLIYVPVCTLRCCYLRCSRTVAYVHVYVWTFHHTTPSPLRLPTLIYHTLRVYVYHALHTPFWTGAEPRWSCVLVVLRCSFTFVPVGAVPRSTRYTLLRFYVTIPTHTVAHCVCRFSCRLSFHARVAARLVLDTYTLYCYT